MKILHVVPTYLPAWRYGGPIRSVHGLAKALVNRGHEVHVYTTNIDGPKLLDVPLSSPVNIDGVMVHYFPCNLFFRRLYISKAMKKMVLSNIAKFDVVHLHSVFLWPTWMVGRLAQKKGVPYILSPRGMLIKELIRKKNFVIKMLWIFLFERQVVAGARYIHFTTKLECDEFLRLNFISKRFVIIPNGYDTEDRLESHSMGFVEFENSTARPYIIFVGRVNWKKGLDRLIMALSHIPDYHLLVVGNDDGMINKLSQQSIRLGLHKRVHFLGEVKGDAKKRLIKKSKMLVLPSYSENFGNVLLEAMALGKSVAVTKDVGLVNDIVTRGAGILMPDDPVAMGKKLTETLSNEILLNKMGEAGLKFSRSFEWDVIAKEFEVAYQGL